MDRALDIPFTIGGAGRTTHTGDDDHVRDMIFAVLFTNPGERVNRPDFGCGLRSLVFGPASQAIAATTKLLVTSALHTWLRQEITVIDVDVQAIDSEVVATVVYRRRGSAEQQVAQVRSAV